MKTVIKRVGLLLMIAALLGMNGALYQQQTPDCGCAGYLCTE